jgi:rhodanese-related sulfurtransferase
MPSAHDPPPVPVLDREQLRARLAAGPAFKLVMVASDFAFRAKHIPGSLHVKAHGDTFAGLAKDDDIVVYCSNVDCNASKSVVKQLVALGYQKVSHYAGGLIDWEAAGLPVEGDWATAPQGPA